MATTSAEPSYHEEIPLLPTSHDDDDANRSEPENGSSNTTNDKKATSRKKGQYSLFVAICFSLNYSIGSGILGLPFEYYNAGFVLGSILLIFIGFLTYITYCYVVDAMQRAEAITTLAMKKYLINKNQLLSDPQNTKQILSGIPTQLLQSEYKLERNEYQLSELLGMFAGKWWRLTYDISYGLSTLIALWSYCALFGVSLSRNIGIPGISRACDMESTYESNENCRGLYSLYVCLFWIWTVIMSLMDFSEQQGVQIFATFARAIIIFLMIFTSIGLLYSNWYYIDGIYVNNSLSSGEYASGVLAWKWSGMAYMIAVSAFAYGNQYCVTDIIQPLTLSDRRTKQHSLWAWSVFICIAVYVCCGITISIYYGSQTESPCTLSWTNFMGFDYTTTQPIWATIIAWFIVLFPAIDIGSAYPLNCVTLANTLESVILSTANANEMDNNKKDDDLIDNEEEETRTNSICNYDNRYNVLLRILICTITAILALIEWNFALILAISGAFNLLAVYGGPCVLEWKSRELMKKITNNDDNAHITPLTKKWTNHPSWLITIAGISVIAFIAIFVDLIQEYSQ